MAKKSTEVFKRTFDLVRGKITVEVHKWDEDYYGRAGNIPEVSVHVDFKTKNCNDGVFVNTSEMGWLPEEITAYVEQFNAFADSVAEARYILNKQHTAQRLVWSGEDGP